MSERPTSTPLQKLEGICAEIYSRWDKDQRPGKLLSALAGGLTNYRADVDAVRAALAATGDRTAVPHDQREPESTKWKAGDVVRFFTKTGTLKSPTNEKEPSGLWWVDTGAVSLVAVHEDEFTPVSPGKGEGWRAMEVVQIQPDDDCPGLWIGFKTDVDRNRAMTMFALPRDLKQETKS